MKHCFIDPAVAPYKNVTKTVRIKDNWFMVLAETASEFFILMKGANQYVRKSDVCEVKII